MPIPITVPRQGWSMEEGTFVEWLKRDGDAVRAGEPLFVLESDKSTENIESVDSGVLRITAESPPPGSIVKVGQILAYLTAVGETVVSRQSDNRSEVKEIGASGANVRSLTESAASVPTDPAPAGKSARRSPRVTPRARRAARELNLDVHALTGSGRDGRIRERDVRAASVQGRLMPHTPLRRTIAARMVAGVTQAAPVTLTTKADATQLVELINGYKTNQTTPPSYTDVLLVLTAATLKQFPFLQAQWRDEGLFVPQAIDIALAVDTEAGLFAPVVRQADECTVHQVSSLTRALIAAARAGKLTAEQMRGATFTITNLGMFGIDAFTPIITLPQCAVLGVGRIVKEPAVINDQVLPRAMMTLSLTFDHRVVDGAPAARFLDTLRRWVEKPLSAPQAPTTLVAVA